MDIECPHCARPANWSCQGSTGWASCEPCRVSGEICRIKGSLGRPDRLYWAPGSPVLRAGIGAQVEVNTGAGEMTPAALRGTNPRWGYGIVTAADARDLVVQFEVPYFGKLIERFRRSDLRMAGA